MRTVAILLLAVLLAKAAAAAAACVPDDLPCRIGAIEAKLARLEGALRQKRETAGAGAQQQGSGQLQVDVDALKVRADKADRALDGFERLLDEHFAELTWLVQTERARRLQLALPDPPDGPKPRAKPDQAPALTTAAGKGP